MNFTILMVKIMPGGVMIESSDHDVKVNRKMGVGRGGGCFMCASKQATLCV